MLAIGEESFVAEHGIPCVRRGRQPADLVVIGGGQMFMRPLTEARLRREAVRVERLLPRGQSFALIGYPEQPPGDGSLDVLADTIAAALAPFDRPVQLVGTSYGALVAVRVAARHPEIVSRLALISGGHAFGDEGARRVRRQALLASHHAFDWLQRDLVDLFGRPWFSWLLRLRLVLRRADPVQEMSEAGVIRAYLEAALAATAETDTTWMSNIAARTLVIAGSRDQFFAIPRLRETVEAISHARLVLLPGETHMAPVERPATVRRELGAFLDTATNMAGSR